MIVYDKLWKTMRAKKITQYDLYTKYGVSNSLLDRLRKNKNIEMYTLNKLCAILDCSVEEIATFVKDDVPPVQNLEKTPEAALKKGT